MSDFITNKTEPRKRFRVLMIEPERGWGQRIDEVRRFKTLGAARGFCTRYNRKYNNQPTTPDWYIKAMIDPDCVPNR
jgi:hypothetical protein